MNAALKNVVRIGLLILIGIVVGIGISSLYQKLKAPKQTVSVVGQGEVDATTDQVNIDIQVKNTAPTQEAAQNENKKDVDSLKSALKKLGIPESRITQSSFAPPVYANDTQGGPSTNIIIRPPAPTTTPTDTTNFTVVLDNLKNINNVFSTINSNPNTQITNTYYSIKDRQGWETKAKEAALKDARNQVETIAKINHLKVGRLISISDQNILLPVKGIQPMMKTLTEGANSANNNAYYGEQTVKINASYNAVYELY